MMLVTEIGMELADNGDICTLSRGKDRKPWGHRNRKEMVTPKFGAGKMAQWLRVLVVLAEHLGSVLSTHIVVHNHL